ncbi:response regulator [Shewanella alkalitolerans]|uniref:response regulator n=1 Tax=Shewanella alkalitolerans TaxID=2864209 RepID=UPI001C6586FD|nr:response regulator [Shewanella alkalitolerans]QYJ97005.1 response regulator [Shewanella alkalitolerans]
MSYILLVEDDRDIAENVEMFLAASDFETKHLDTGERVVETVKAREPALILLDLMLPIKDGLTCCREIREFSDVPIIMLTAKIEEVDRLVGLESGADDYVCKPFSAVELILRIKAILRRTMKSKPSPNLTLDKVRLKIAYHDKVVELTHLEFNLFSLLYDQPGRIYSRQQILDLAYPDMRDISDRAIDSHVKNIRKKGKQLGLAQPIIDSVYGVGYRFTQPELE